MIPRICSNIIFDSSVHLGTQMLGKRQSHLQRFRLCTFVAPFIKQTIVKVNEKGTQKHKKLTAVTAITTMKTSRVTDRTHGKTRKWTQLSSEKKINSWQGIRFVTIWKYAPTILKSYRPPTEQLDECYLNPYWISDIGIGCQSPFSLGKNQPLYNPLYWGMLQLAVRYLWGKAKSIHR